MLGVKGVQECFQGSFGMVSLSKRFRDVQRVSLDYQWTSVTSRRATDEFQKGSGSFSRVSLKFSGF